MSAVPAEFPPPVDPAGEFVGATAPEEEPVEAGVVIVGAGPAGLSCAIRLSQLLADDPALAEGLGAVPVAVVEKGKNPGSHLLSGAIMHPSGLRELLPDVDPSEWPTFGRVEAEAAYLLSRKRCVRLVPTPPPFRNRGNWIVSVAQLGRWLAERAERAGVHLLRETAATKLLVADEKVVGVRTGDKGRSRDGEELESFEPGADLMARATVLAEGSQGHLTEAAIGHFGLAKEDPQQWELGVKEVWKVPAPLDRVLHTMGWPLRWSARYREFGGSFVYPMGEDMVSIGFVAGLDYRDATFSVHDVLQELKTHPRIRSILEGGHRVAWGAKTIPSGGYWGRPRKIWVPGMCIAGDSAGMVDVPRLKGLHYAMHAGIHAAEAIIEALRSGSTADLSGYAERVRGSAIERDTYRSRNMRQPFAKGFFVGAALAGIMELSGGRLPPGRWRTHDDAEAEVFIGDRDLGYPRADGEYIFDKLSSVYASGNATRDDAPNPIRVRKKVPLEIALMWRSMCPAQVYEVPDELPEARPRGGDGSSEPEQLVDVRVTPSNCVQCGAITAKGGRLTPAEGGDGPNYELT